MRVNTKPKLRRPCKRCEEMFIPNGRDVWICPNCNLRGIWRKKLSDEEFQKKIKEGKLNGMEKFNDRIEKLMLQSQVS